jgi:hypothetical protein
MSVESSLVTLGFQSLDDVTAETLKKAFKSAAMKAHPDRGGKEGDFDNVLSAYIILFDIIKRLTGGRDGLQTIFVEDVQKAREEQFVSELNNMMNEIMDQIDTSSHEAFNKAFNEQFESIHQEQEQGYDEWFRATADANAPFTEPLTPLSVETIDLNQAFESALSAKKPIGSSIILHPDEMGFVSCKTSGAAIIPLVGHSFTSEPEMSPEYTDLKEAYTSDNTIYDKLPEYHESDKTLEVRMADYLLERDTVYETVADQDKEAIAAYEKRKQEEELAHKERIAEYFKSASVSQWALRGVNGTMDDSASKEEDTFVKEI